MLEKEEYLQWVGGVVLGVTVQLSCHSLPLQCYTQHTVKQGKLWGSKVGWWRVHRFYLLYFFIEIWFRVLKWWWVTREIWLEDNDVYWNEHNNWFNEGSWNHFTESTGTVFSLQTGDLFEETEWKGDFFFYVGATVVEDCRKTELFKVHIT